jgi:hypothetical protein
MRPKLHWHLPFLGQAVNFKFRVTATKWCHASGQHSSDSESESSSKALTVWNLKAQTVTSVLHMSHRSDRCDSIYSTSSSSIDSLKFKPVDTSDGGTSSPGCLVTLMASDFGRVLVVHLT